MKQYERYKESGVEWLGRVPEDWEIRKLKNVCDINPLYKNYQVKDNEEYVTFLPMEKVTEYGQYDNSSMERYKRICNGFTYFEVNDIIVAKITPCFENGKGAFLDSLATKIGFGSTEFHVLRKHSDIDGKFLYYVTKSYNFRQMGEAMMTGSAGQKRVPTHFLTNYRSAIPIDIFEQQKIAAYLDQISTKIDKAISQKERVIELLNERRQIIIQRAVTRGLDPSVPMKDSGVDWIGEIPEHWEVRKLKTFCDFVNRGTTPNYESSGYKVVNQATFSKGFFDESDVRYTSLKNIDARGYLKKGDLLLASTGGGVLGKSFLFQEEGEYIADSHVTILRDSKERFFPSFLIKFLSIHFDLINGILAQGSTNQIELQREWLRDMQFPYPFYNEQQQIATYLDNVNAKIDKAIAIKRQEIEKLKEYKTVLIDAAITGKIKIA